MVAQTGGAQKSLPSITGEWLKQPLDAYIAGPAGGERVVHSPPAERATLLHGCRSIWLARRHRTRSMRFSPDVGPDALERLVDRLLASPHYGERWGRHWLDLARYADSDGYERTGRGLLRFLHRDWWSGIPAPTCPTTSYH